MTSFLKHIGILKNTSKKVVIIFHELENSNGQALVCDMEALPARMHDALTSIVESNEAQNGETKDLYELLSRRLFPDTGTPVINELHNRGYLFTTPQSNVIVMPRPNVQIPLDVLMSEMKRLNSKLTKNQTDTNSGIPSDLPPDVRRAALQAQQELQQASATNQSSLLNEDVSVNASFDVVADLNKPVEGAKAPEKFNQHSHNLRAEKTENRIALAQSLLKQASLLKQEVDGLIKKAVSLAPELAGNNPMTANMETPKAATTTVREPMLDNSDIPKKTNSNVKTKPVAKSSVAESSETMETLKPTATETTKPLEPIAKKKPATKAPKSNV